MSIPTTRPTGTPAPVSAPKPAKAVKRLTLDLELSLHAAFDVAIARSGYGSKAEYLRACIDSAIAEDRQQEAARIAAGYMAQRSS